MSKKQNKKIKKQRKNLKSSSILLGGKTLGHHCHNLRVDI